MGTGARHRIMTVAMAVVAVVFFLDQVLEIDWPEGALWPLRIVLLLAAVVVAGIAYAGWSGGEPAAPATVPRCQRGTVRAAEHSAQQGSRKLPGSEASDPVGGA